MWTGLACCRVSGVSDRLITDHGRDRCRGSNMVIETLHILEPRKTLLLFKRVKACSYSEQ